MFRLLVVVVSVIAMVAAWIGAPTTSASPSTPEPRLMLTSDRTGTYQTYTVGLDGKLAGLSDRIPGLVNPPWLGSFPYSYAVPSHDGQYSAIVDGSPSASLAIADVDGRPLRVYDPSFLSVSWSPVANVIALGGWDGMVAGLVGKEVPLVWRVKGAAMTAISWSPDGRRLAYLLAISGRSASNRVFVVDYPSGKNRAVGPEGVTSGPEWSPRGDKIAYVTGGVVETIASDGSDRRRIGTVRLARWEPPSLSWSPDGRTLALAGARGLTLVDVARATQRRVLTIPVEGFAWGLTDGAYTVSVNGEVRIVDAGGKTHRFLTLAAGEHVSSLSWFTPPAGMHFRPAKPVRRLFDPSSGNELLVRTPVTELAASPSGQVAVSTCDMVAGWKSGDRLIKTTFRAVTAPACGWPYHRPYGLAAGDATIAYWGISKSGNFPYRPLTVESAAGKRIVGEWRRANYETAPDFGGPVFATSAGVVFSMTPFECAEKRCDPLGTAIYSATVSGSGGGCPQLFYSKTDLASGPCAIVVPSEQGLVLLGAGGDRLAVRRGSGVIEIVDLEGRRVSSLPVSATPVFAWFDGGSVVVLARGALQSFDSSTGRLLGSVSLPDVSASGPCLIETCVESELVVRGVMDGLAAYRLGGAVHLRRLADGKDIVLDGVLDAIPVKGGLIVADAAPNPPWLTRIRRVSRDELAV